ncbi:MAG TPA: sulfatase-like hydrolase/transferase, partial [Limnochordia bacterium]|nr:sulfatase-like hydrolase/transferase [Limnochordia bacterium]
WVHGDGCPPGVTSTRLATKADRIPPHVWRKIRSCYYGLITEIDHQLGRLFGAMRFLNLLDDTLILFTSDHGEMLGDHELMNKSVLYDAAARVPLIVRPPAAWKIPEPGRVARAPVTLADVLPTLVEAGGGELPNGIDGRSFLPLVKGESVAWRDCVPGNVGDQQFSLTDGRVKYIWHRWGDIEQLFDLEHDPHEARDLSGDAAWAERRAEWRGRLIAFLSEKGSPATDGERLLPIERPLPSERALRARNPFGYTDGRPWT